MKHPSINLLRLSYLLAFFVGCTGAKQKTIQIAGSTTVLPPVSIAAERFHEANSDIRVIVNAGGSGVGINQAASRKIDLGMASREISSKERHQFEGTNLKTTTIGYDAVAVAVSSEIYEAGIKVLTLAQIRAIYSGEISNWSQLGGPNLDILVLDKEASRGTRHVFMDIVFGDEYAKAAGADLVLGSNNEEQTAIQQSDAAIGMLSHAWLNKEVKGLGILVGDEPVEASLENIVSGKYPIVRSLNLVYTIPLKPEAQEFLNFLLGAEGQSIVEKEGYVAVAP